MDEAAAEGVKIVSIDSEVNSSAVECYIGTDNYEAGCLAGEAVLDCQDPVLNIGIVNYDKNSENGQTREAGLPGYCGEGQPRGDRGCDQCQFHNGGGKGGNACHA